MKSQGFLAKHRVSVAETADAGKLKLARSDALKLARSVSRVIAAKGKNVVSIDLRKDPPDDATLAALLLGPTGNLRAPTIRQGRTLLVGFHPDVYAALL